MSKTLKVILATTALIAMSACAHKDEKQEVDPVAQKQQAAAQAQARADEAQAEAQRAQNDVVKQQLAGDKEAYVQQTQERIARLNQRSDELRKRAASATGPQQKKLTNVSDDLDSMINQVRRDFANVQTAAPENFLDAKRDVEKDIGRAEEAYSSSLNVYR